MELLHGLLPTGVLLKDMGEYHLKGLLLPEHIFQVVAPDLPDSFPPPRASSSCSAFVRTQRRI